VIRTILYLLAALALFVLGFVLITAFAVSVQGLAAVRSDTLSQIVTAYAFIGLPASIFAALWFAQRRR
jgi:hypothetical protein